MSFAIQQGAFDGSCKGPIELQKKREYFRQLFSDAADAKDGHGLKLEKTWPLCSSLKMAPCSSLKMAPLSKKGSFATSKIGVFYTFA